MIESLQQKAVRTGAWKWLIAAAALIGAAYLGLHPSRRWLILLGGGLLGLALVLQPVLGLPALVLAALLVPMEFGTGTEVSLNPATLLVPALLVLWVLKMVRDRDLRLAPSRTNGPLLLFLATGLLSLLVGNVLWDPSVPRMELSVQLAQWAIFAFSAGAFWLTANLIEDETWLRGLTFTFLVVGGGLATTRALPLLSPVAGRVGTIALTRAPFWMLLTAVAGGQLLFNEQLRAQARVVLALLLGGIVFYAFFQLRESASAWVSVGAVLGFLVWLRWPRLRWLVIVSVATLTAIGFVQSAVWEFAGGEEEWLYTGAPRLQLIRHVIRVALRNPITGLGPASYRAYANNQPFLMGPTRVWVGAVISSHNNYVDLFAHTGLLGMSLFLWFGVEIGRLGLRLRGCLSEGFLAGYVNGALAAGAGSLILMLLADWILPFVYNIGFLGFQASVLVWMFMGGLVGIDNMAHDETRN